VVRALDALLPELGEAMTGAFTEAGAAGREFDRVAEALGGTLVEAFKGAFEGESFREVLLKIIQDVLVLSQTSAGGAADSTRDMPRRKQRRPRQSSRFQPNGRFIRTYEITRITNAA
jgi:hypothetical protein